MNRPTSLYLDLIRFLAAMMVFLSHASSSQWTGGILWQIRPYGGEAVVVFFVLSGFVIAYATEERERSARVYVVNRMARIYSVTIPALLLTFGLDAIGRRADPSLYLHWLGDGPMQVMWQFLNSIMFTNQIWLNNVQPGTTEAYWSMGYEIPYYVVFGIAWFAPRRWGLAGAAVVLLILGPNIASLFPMWLLGLASYRLCARRPLGTRSGLVLWAASIVALALVEIPTHPRQLTYHDLALTPDRLQNTAHYYLTAVLFTVNIIGFRGASPLLASPLETASRAIRWAGQRTFALYLFHTAIMQFIVAVIPWPPSSWVTRAVVWLGVPTIVFALAEVTERRKDSWRKLFAALLGATSPRKAAL